MPSNMSSKEDSIRTAYDTASAAYAQKFLRELDGKPFDRELLTQFAMFVGAEALVLDIGCGPGHTTAHLTGLGLKATGVDLSPKMIERAAEFFPQSSFTVGNFFSLPSESKSIAGILAFYSIVHLDSDQLVPAFTEMIRVLDGGGILLLAFHVGSHVVRAENFLDTGAALDFTFFEPAEIEVALTTAGFEQINCHTRAPYDFEHPSIRCYMFARKPRSTA